MAAEASVDVHPGASRCLLGLFDAAGGLADWSEFDAEAEHGGIEVRGLSHEGLRTLIESSTLACVLTAESGADRTIGRRVERFGRV